MTGGGITTGGGTGTGGVLQAASANATIPSERGKLRAVEDIRIDMWILMLEAGVALFLLVFIVWWTMYADKPKNEQQALPPADKKEPPQQLDQ